MQDIIWVHGNVSLFFKFFGSRFGSGVSGSPVFVNACWRTSWQLWLQAAHTKMKKVNSDWPLHLNKKGTVVTGPVYKICSHKWTIQRKVLLKLNLSANSIVITGLNHIWYYCKLTLLSMVLLEEDLIVSNNVISELSCARLKLMLNYTSTYSDTP